MNKILTLLRPTAVTHWLQHHSSLWPGALGAALGLGIGIGALFGITGITGMGLCLLVIAGALWRAWDAEPVLVGLDTEPEPLKESEPDLQFVEPLAMVELSGGTFLMGSPDLDREAFDNEKPQHRVTLSAFAISRYPITRQLYRDIVGAAPEQWERDKDEQNLPANDVSWFDAARFCNALSERVGLSLCYRIEGDNVEWDREAEGYRLPTEAEWEFACRAGTVSSWFFGDNWRQLSDYAWFGGNSGNKVHPVGEKKPNPWGLYDMLGNVWEWCWDWYAEYPHDVTLTLDDPIGPEEGTDGVLRGGAMWDDVPREFPSRSRNILVVLQRALYGNVKPRLLRSTARFWVLPKQPRDDVGFRCVRSPRQGK